MGKVEAVVPKHKGNKASVPGAQGARECDEAGEVREAVKVKILHFIVAKWEFLAATKWEIHKFMLLTGYRIGCKGASVGLREGDRDQRVVVPVKRDSGSELE